MCGLFGFALQRPVKNLDRLLIQLAMYNENRGKDSWGIYDQESDKLIKDVGPVSLSFYEIPKRESGLVMGHTRAATVGDVTVANSHPWVFKGEKGLVIGAHNGAIYNHKDMNDKYKTNLEVDSMHIFSHMANGRPQSDLEGYGAVTFLFNGHLYLGRFNSGVLSVAHIEGDNGIIWSSDEGALTRACESAGLKYTTYTIVENAIYTYRNGSIYVLKNDKFLIGSTRTRSVFTNNGWNSHQSFHRGTSGGSSSTTSKKPIIIRFRVVPDSTAPIVSESHDSMTAALDEAQSLPKGSVDDELEAIKAKIFNDDTLSEIKDHCFPCETCHECQTTRRLKGTYTAICLPCLAKKVQKGELQMA